MAMVVDLCLILNIQSPTRHRMKGRPTPEPHSPSISAASCRQDNVYLLKMHKTGSTTMFNILNRVAIRRNLRMTTYTKRPYWSSDPDAMVRFLSPKFVVGNSKKYNMHGQHSRYDKNVIPQILLAPYANVTFVRHPVIHLRSWLYAYKLVQSLRLKGPDPVVDFLSNLDVYRERRGVKRTKNPMANELRMDTISDENSLLFQQSLREIDRTFIIGLTEYYTESLVLLKRRLCWDLRDVIHVPLRRTGYQRPVEDRENKLLGMACAWSNLDCQLYDYFNRSFWEAISKEGPGFHDEVTHLNRILARTFDYCTSIYHHLKNNSEHIEELDDTTPPLTFRSSEWNERFDIRVVDCALMRAGVARLEHLSFYIQNKAECESAMSGSGYKCHNRNPKTSNPCALMCGSTNDTKTMVRNFLKANSTYLWV